MAYFVTGATGFIGSNLIPLLLERTARKRGAAGEIHLLVRESSLARHRAPDRRLGGESTRPRARA